MPQENTAFQEFLETIMPDQTTFQAIFEAGQAAGKPYTASNRRPALTIESEGQTKLGNCYWQYLTKITCIYKLKDETIQGMRNLGLIANGQEFRVLRVEELADHWAFDGNTYDGKPYPINAHPYYVYHVETRVDSGD